MSVKKDMYLEQVVIENDNGLPALLREVADYVELNNLVLWDLLIEPESDDDGFMHARLILNGFRDILKG